MCSKIFFQLCTYLFTFYDKLFFLFQLTSLVRFRRGFHLFFFLGSFRRTFNRWRYTTASDAESYWTGISTLFKVRFSTWLVFHTLFLSQAKCCVTNEADAELALQVSNALTQALLQYRMRNMPANVSVYDFVVVEWPFSNFYFRM